MKHVRLRGGKGGKPAWGRPPLGRARPGTVRDYSAAEAEKLDERGQLRNGPILNDQSGYAAEFPHIVRYERHKQSEGMRSQQSIDWANRHTSALKFSPNRPVAFGCDLIEFNDLQRLHKRVQSNVILVWIVALVGAELKFRE